MYGNSLVQISVLSKASIFTENGAASFRTFFGLFMLVPLRWFTDVSSKQVHFRHIDRFQNRFQWTYFLLYFQLFSMNQIMNNECTFNFVNCLA